MKKTKHILLGVADTLLYWQIIVSSLSGVDILQSIILIVPYFGKLPDDFSLWLSSCSFNPTINWLIYTDQDTSDYDVPNNISIKKCNLCDLKAAFQKHFDFSISLENPYKLCDFKPAYGDMFEKEIADYDFWGYCDIDLVFGNIRNFITDDILCSYDRMFVFGHLSIYRNSPEMRELYRSKVDNCLYYKDVFSSPDSYAFDEFGYKSLGGLFQICSLKKIKVYNKILFAYAMEKYFALRCTYGGSLEQRKLEMKKKKVFFEFRNGQLVQRWGKTAKGEKEICYIHIRLRKMLNFCTDDKHFYIYPGEYTNNSKKHFIDFGLNPEYIKWRIKRLKDYMTNLDYVKWRLNDIIKKASHKHQ